MKPIHKHMHKNNEIFSYEVNNNYKDKQVTSRSLLIGWPIVLNHKSSKWWIGNESSHVQISHDKIMGSNPETTSLHMQG